MVYDDEQCPKRGPALCHISHMGQCPYCGEHVSHRPPPPKQIAGPAPSDDRPMAVRFAELPNACRKRLLFHRWLAEERGEQGDREVPAKT